MYKICAILSQKSQKMGQKQPKKCPLRNQETTLTLEKTHTCAKKAFFCAKSNTHVKKTHHVPTGLRQRGPQRPVQNCHDVWHSRSNLFKSANKKDTIWCPFRCDKLEFAYQSFYNEYISIPRPADMMIISIGDVFF